MFNNVISFVCKINICTVTGIFMFHRVDSNKTFYQFIIQTITMFVIQNQQDSIDEDTVIAQTFIYIWKEIK